MDVNPANINMVGHSFGSHVCAFAGKQVYQDLNVKIGRITVTDAARRPFESSSISKDDKLTNEDADFVVAIHGDAGLRGFKDPVGTVDFYPNGGLAPQPGCENSDDIRRNYLYTFYS